jgi:L-fuculose-phosphate aldolase
MSMSQVHGVDRSPLEEVLEFGRRMLRDGLVIGTSGNISVRVPAGIVITPSTIPYDEITVEDLCLLDEDGTQLAGRGRPSAETPMHLAVYGSADAAAVVHTHSPVAVAVSTVVDELPAIHYGIAQFGGSTVRVADYERFGSDALADATLRAFEGRRGALLRNHGTTTYGASLGEAYYRAQLLEWLAVAYWRAKTMGEPRIIGEDEIEKVVAESRRRRYGTIGKEGSGVCETVRPR